MRLFYRKFRSSLVYKISNVESPGQETRNTHNSICSSTLQIKTLHKYKIYFRTQLRPILLSAQDASSHCYHLFFATRSLLWLSMTNIDPPSFQQIPWTGHFSLPAD